MDFLDGVFGSGKKKPNPSVQIKALSREEMKLFDADGDGIDDQDPSGFSIIKARVFLYLSTMIYFGEDDWASSKPMNLSTIRNVEELSPAIRMKMGDYARQGGAGVVADYKLFGRFSFRTLGDKYNAEVNEVNGRVLYHHDLGGAAPSPVSGPRSMADQKKSTLRNGFMKGNIMHDTDAFLCEIFDNTNPNQKCLVLVFRGTQEGADIRTDLKGSSKPSPLPAEHKMGTEGKVHRGFREAWYEVRDMVLKAVSELLATGEYKEIYVTGHSLGGALATLASISISQLVSVSSQKVQLVSYTYGSPRVGDKKFQEDYNKNVPKTYRMQNDEDIVPHVPLRFHGFRHVGDNIFMNKNGIWRIKPDQKLLAEDRDDDQPTGQSWNAWLTSSTAEKGNDHKTCAYMEQLALYDYLSQMPLHLRPRCPFPCKCASHNTWVRRAWKALMTKPTLYRLDTRGHTLHCVVGGKCYCTMMPSEDDSGRPNYVAMEKVLDEGGLMEKMDLTGAEIVEEAQYQAGALVAVGYPHFEGAVAKLLFAPQPVLDNRRLVIATKNLFSTYDSDNDGFLSWAEFQTLCSEVYPQMSDSDIKNAFVELDATHVYDGKISRFEFSLWKRLTSVA